MSNIPEVSVIIPAWNGEKYIDECLTSLANHLVLPYEIIVIDNGSDDKTAEIAINLNATEVLRNSHNEGFARAVNRCLQIARGKILFLLNQDTVTVTDWLTPIVKRFQQGKKIGIVGCKLLYPDGSVQHAGAKLIEPIWLSEHQVSDRVKGPLDFVTGAAMAIRRECFESVGFLDEGFQPAYYEDVDLCLRAQKLGWDVSYEPNSILIHYESQSRPEAFKLTAMVNTNRLRLIMKHRSLDWLRNQWLVAEIAHLDDNDSVNWLAAMAHAYHRAIYFIIGVLTQRSEFSGKSVADCVDIGTHLQQSLWTMRAYALTRLSQSHLAV